MRSPRRLASRGIRQSLALVGLSLLMLAPGCATTQRIAQRPVSAPPPSLGLDSVPEWALAGSRRDVDSEFGVGSGKSLDEATRYALQDVASRLSVSVESELRDVYRESSGTSVESLEQVIETRVTGTRFSGWERTRSAQAAGTFWVEVRIDRHRLVRDSVIELAELSEQVDNQLESARGSALRRLLALQATSESRERAASLVALLDVLDPGFDRSVWDARSARWREIDTSARRSLVFEVRSDRASQEIARWLETRLASERIATREGGCVSADAVCIDIRSELTEADIARRHVARIRSFFALLEPDGAIVRQADLTGRGDSTSDRDRARRAAIDDLRQRISASSVLDGLLAP